MTGQLDKVGNIRGTYREVQYTLSSFSDFFLRVVELVVVTLGGCADFGGAGATLNTYALYLRKSSSAKGTTRITEYCK